MSYHELRYEVLYQTLYLSRVALWGNTRGSPRGQRMNYEAASNRVSFNRERGKECAMSEGVDKEVLSSVWDNQKHSLNKLRVLLFCMKYPKLRFTIECVAVNQGEDKVVLADEIQSLISQGILGKGDNGGITYYCLNKTQQELTELTEGFLKDWHLHEIGNKS